MSLPDSSAPATPPDSETPAAPPSRFRLRTLLREILETILLTLIIYAAVNLTTGRFRVEGTSMYPNFHPNEYVLVDKLSYRLRAPQRGEVVVFEYPLAAERDFIKRVIGLPGETVSVHDSKVWINGQPLEEPYIAAPPNYSGAWTLGADEYFVMGDNRNGSSDSHSWGPLKKHYLIGRAVLVYWPSTAWHIMPHYSYTNVVTAQAELTPTIVSTPPTPAPTLPPPTPYPADWLPTPAPTLPPSPNYP